jgi:peroxiredoxin
VLLMNLREDPATVARTVKERGYAAPTLLDRTGEVADAYDVTGTPTTYVIGRDGRILGRAIGPRPWTEPPGRAFFRALLAPGPPPR